MNSLGCGPPNYVRALFFKEVNTKCSHPMSREFRLATFICWMVPLFNHYLFSFLEGRLHDYWSLHCHV